MRFFNLDQHCAVVEDIARIFKRLGHEIDSVNFTGHNFVFNRPKVNSFGGFTPDHYWQYLEGKFYSELKDKLASYDGFISCYPPCFAWLYKDFGKPIICQIPIRYEHFMSFNPVKWGEFNAWIREATEAGQLYPVANNAYDAAYFKHFTGVEADCIPNLCDYTGQSYSPSLETALLWDTRSERLDREACSRVPALRALRATYPRYEWDRVVKHRAFVHIPYNCSVMSMFEHYSMGVPIFVPSPEFLLYLKESFGALSELTWNQSCGLKPQGSAIKPYVESGTPDPNLYNDEASLRSWMGLYDHYRLPYLEEFGSWKELAEKLADDTLLYSTSQVMKEHQRSRANKIVDGWGKLLKEIQA